MGAVRRRVADRALVLGYRLGWGAVRALPAGAAYRVFDLIADRTVARAGKGTQRLRHNYALVRPELDDARLDALVREGMRSYLRYYCDAFRLPDLPPEVLARSVRLVGAEHCRQVLEGGGSVVVFLGHMGNWDLAGAWSTSQLAPVTTVAERLQPAEVFDEFLEFRTSLGMTILPLDGGADTFAGLRRAATQGQFICLLADRDLSGSGVQVQLCGHPARMAKGPAALALVTGAPLYAVSIHYEPNPAVPGSGWGVVCDFSPLIEAPTSGTTAQKVAVMTQACADYLGDAIRTRTSDWHMLQRVFGEAPTPPPAHPPAGLS
ncbi:MAG: phosphatidylinositol mannoside acyltransferase [Actinomycetota bacterium]|nr:phosphatidylinositol mannoside acyltransferase [Actinomycetota bacterium]